MSDLVPDVIHWYLTYRCNLACSFCFSAKEGGEESKESKLTLADKIITSGVKKVTLTGGEPLIARNVDEIVDKLTSSYVHDPITGEPILGPDTGEPVPLFVSIHTHGLNLRSLRLEQYRRIAETTGNIRISLSLDGATSEIADEMRGRPKYFEDTIRLLGKLRDNGIPVSVKTMASSKNFQDLYDMPKVLAPFREVLAIWNVQEFVPVNWGYDNRAEYELKDNAMDILQGRTSLPSLVQECKRHKIPYTILPRKAHSEHKYFFLQHDGTVKTNVSEGTEELIGDLKAESVQEIWDKIKEFHRIDDPEEAARIQRNYEKKAGIRYQGPLET